MPFNRTEYEQLSAYARFRILFLDLLQGQFDQAGAAYQSLLANHPEGNAGYPFAQMATIFWTDYQASGDLYSACEQAQAFAGEHEEMFEYLGSHGLHSPGYVDSMNVCPYWLSVPPE
jgi:hypothetical protein